MAPRKRKASEAVNSCVQLSEEAQTTEREVQSAPKTIIFDPNASPEPYKNIGSPLQNLRKRQRLSKPIPDSQPDVLFVSQKCQPGKRRAVVKVFGRQKDIDDCRAFLQKFSGDQDGSLTVQTMLSPTLSVVNTLEIRSWSTGVQTPEYFHELELYRKREKQYSPTLPPVSPYPDAVVGPQRFIPIPEYDVLQVALFGLKAAIHEHIKLYSSLRNSEDPPTYTTATDGLWDMTYMESAGVLITDNHMVTKMRGVAQSVTRIEHDSLIHAILIFFHIISRVDEGLSWPLVHRLLWEMTQLRIGNQNPLMQKLTVSALRQGRHTKEMMLTLARCVSDTLGPNTAEEADIHLFDLKGQIVEFYCLTGNFSLAAKLLENMRLICERLSDTLGTIENEQYLELLGHGYSALGKCQEAANHFTLAIERQASSGQYWSLYTADMWSNKAYCSKELGLWQDACFAAQERIDILLHCTGVSDWELQSARQDLRYYQGRAMSHGSAYSTYQNQFYQITNG